MPQTIAVVSDIDPSGGGSHQWALNIFHALNDYRLARGDVSVVVIHYGKHSAGHPLAVLFPDFRFVSIGIGGNVLARVMRRFAVACPDLLPLIRWLFPLNWVAARQNAEVILFPVTVLDSLLCNRKHIFCLADIAHVYYPHFPEVSEGGQARLRYVLFQYGLANASLVMVESQELRREIAKHYGADPAKAFVVPQVPPRFFLTARHADSAPLNAEPYLFYPAQLWAHKNHLNLLTAVASLSKDFPSLQLVLCGSRKPGDEVIFAKIEELGLEKRVHYLGYVPDERMPQLYRNAAALVMPTYFGPSNIPTLEAFAFGCPAIISDLPGVEEQVGDDAALRFDPNDPADIADKIAEVLRNPALAARMVEAGKARLNELSYDHYRLAMCRLFDAALQAKR